MKILFLILFVVLFILLLLFYPYKIKGSFHINLKENIGFVVFKVLFIRLLAERFKIGKTGRFETEREKDKGKNQDLFRNYILNLAKKVDVKKIDVIIEVGGSDAYELSVFAGSVGVIINSLFAMFLNKYKDIKIFNNFLPDYEEEKFEATGKFIVTFTLVEALTSFIVALKESRNQKKEKINV